MPAFWHPHGFGNVKEPKPHEMNSRPVGGRFDPKMLDNMTNKAVPCVVVNRDGKFVPVPVDKLTARDKEWIAAQSGELSVSPHGNGNIALKKAS